MVLANESMEQMLSYYLIFCSSMLVIIVLCFVISCSKRSTKNLSIYGVALCVILAIIVFTDVIPFVRDYVKKDIVVEQGMYINTKQDGNSYSNKLGAIGIILKTDNETLTLTTVPGRKNIFTRGSYPVTAYYLPNARILLHIEFAG